MSRPQVEHQDRDSIGGDYTVPPAGEYNTVLTEFDPDGDYQGTKIVKPVLVITDGEFEGKKIIPGFFINVGDKRSEEKMAKFLNKLGIDKALEASQPNGTSWIDEASISFLRLNGVNKAIRVDTYVKKGKPDADGKTYDNSEVIAFMKADMNYPSGTKMPVGNGVSNIAGATQPTDNKSDID